MTLLDLVAPFALSFALVSPFYFVLRARMLSFLAGATLVAAGAFVLELLAQDAAGALAGPTIVLLLVAPAVEEILKFSVAVPTGATFRSAAGAATGFAATENGVYFLAAWSEPVSALVVLVAIRALTDPLLHVTATTLTTSSWRGEPWGFPGGLLLHIGWNSISLVALALAPAVGVVLLLAGAITVLGVFLLARRAPSVEHALSVDHRRRFWGRAAA